MRSLIDHAMSWGREHDTVVEAYPIDTAVEGATQNTFPGVLRPLLDAGFRKQGRLSRDRVVVVSALSPPGGPKG